MIFESSASEGAIWEIWQGPENTQLLTSLTGVNGLIFRHGPSEGNSASTYTWSEL